MLILNVNGLNALIKKYKVMEWIEKKKIQLCGTCKRVTLNLKTQTESDGMQKHIP